MLICKYVFENVEFHLIYNSMNDICIIVQNIHPLDIVENYSGCNFYFVGVITILHLPEYIYSSLKLKAFISARW